jgi:ATP-dependent Clp protease ATP-binding subunit ClpB
VVMTSNIGSQTITELAGEEHDTEIHNRCLRALEQEFLPEFLNRIDEVIVFHPLGKAEIREIVDLQLKQLSAQIEEIGYSLSVNDAAKSLLVEEGYDPVYGARPLKRVIQQRLQNRLANDILAGNFPEGSTIHVDAQQDGFIFSTENEPIENAASRK